MINLVCPKPPNPSFAAIGSKPSCIETPPPGTIAFTNGVLGPSYILLKSG